MKILALWMLVALAAHAETDPVRSCQLLADGTDPLLIGLSLDLENALPSLKDLGRRKQRFAALERVDPDAAVRSLALEMMNGDTARRAQLVLAYKKYVGREPQSQELTFLLDRLRERESWEQVYASVFTHPEYMKTSTDDAGKVLADLAGEAITTAWRTRVMGLDRTSMAILFWREHHSASAKRIKDKFQLFLSRQPTEKELAAAKNISDWHELDANIVALPEYRTRQSARFSFCRASGTSPK